MGNELVEVTWDDAWGSSYWCDKDNFPSHSPLIVTTVGYLIKRDKHGVMLAATKAENGNYSGVVFRPRGMIKKIRKLK